VTPRAWWLHLGAAMSPTARARRMVAECSYGRGKSTALSAS
jgi:hypothetical protein